MIKFRWYYDKDSEELFLNKMSKRGYYLEDFVLGFHIFKKIKDTDYTYRVDLINDKRDKELYDYINLIEESGAEYIKRWGVWGYFRKKGEFELYTDVDSQIGFYTRINRMFSLLAIAEFCISIGQWVFYGDKKLVLNLVCAILFDIIGAAFLYQTIKSNIKIKKLKKEKI